jgi:hypothetical protein
MQYFSGTCACDWLLGYQSVVINSQLELLPRVKTPSRVLDYSIHMSLSRSSSIQLYSCILKFLLVAGSYFIVG